MLAPSIALGSVFGRIGCLLNGCCYGRACDLPWAISFPPGNPLGSPTYPVHPTEIYDALLNLGLYFFLAWLFRRKKFDGQIFATYLHLLRRHALIRRIFSRRLQQRPPSFRPDACATRQRPDFFRRPGARGNSVAARAGKAKMIFDRINRIVRIKSGGTENQNFFAADFKFCEFCKFCLNSDFHRRADCGWQIRDRAAARGKNRRRNHLRRFHAGVSRTRHRHRQAVARRTRPRAASPH